MGLRYFVSVMSTLCLYIDNTVLLFFRGDNTLNGLGKSQPESEVPLTGDPEADADIMAFMKARQKVLQQSKAFQKIIFLLNFKTFQFAQIL